MSKLFFSELDAVGVEYYERSFVIFDLTDKDIEFLKGQRNNFIKLLEEGGRPHHFAFDFSTVESFQGQSDDFRGGIIEISKYSNEDDEMTIHLPDGSSFEFCDMSYVEISNVRIEFDEHYIWLAADERYSELAVKSSIIRWKNLINI